MREIYFGITGYTCGSRQYSSSIMQNLRYRSNDPITEFLVSFSIFKDVLSTRMLCAKSMICSPRLANSDCQKVTDFCIRSIETIPRSKGNLYFTIGKGRHQLGLVAGYFEQIFYMNHVIEAYGTASEGRRLENHILECKCF